MPSPIIYAALFLVSLTAILIHRRTPNPSPSSPLPPPAGCRPLGLTGRSNLASQHQRPAPTTGPPTVAALFVYPIKSCAPLELASSAVVRTGLQYDRQFCFAQELPVGDASSGATNGVGDGGGGGEGGNRRQWKFVTQREFPLLARVRCAVWVPDEAAATHSTAEEYVRTGGCIDVTFPSSTSALSSSPRPSSLSSLGAEDGVGSFLGAVREAVLGKATEATTTVRLPFDPPAERVKSGGYAVSELLIWKDRHRCLDVGSEIPVDAMRALRRFLGATKHPFTLFRVDSARYRPVFRCAPRVEEVGYQPVVGLADAYPLHLLNLASAQHVSASLPRSSPLLGRLDARRFRANVIISGGPAFDEDGWARIAVVRPNTKPQPQPPSSATGDEKGQTAAGDDGEQTPLPPRSEYHVSCRTARCTMPNVDQETGGVDAANQPYAAMKSYRRIDAGAGVYPCLGMQVTPMFDGGSGAVEDVSGVGAPGWMAVGDEVRVLQRTEGHFYIKQ